MNDSIDKAVVLAAGLGTRMRADGGAGQLDAAQKAVANTGVKALIPIAAGRTFLDYVLHEIAEAGYRRVCLVIGVDHQALREYYMADGRLKRLEMSFAIQERPLGTANALAAAEDFAGDEQFLMVNSDNLYPTSACAALRKLGGPGVALFDRKALLRGSNIPADRIGRFAVGLIAADGTLRRIIEKPDHATLSAMGDEVLVGLNCWRFGPAIFEACRKIGPSVRGEYEITDAAQYAIDQLGERFTVVRSSEAVLDLSSRGDIAAVTSKLAGREVRL